MELLDYDAALTRVADDCEYVNPPPLPAVRGPGGVRAVLEPFFAPTLENEFKILRQATNGSAVLIERLDRHRLADKWVELPVTGVFEVQGGLITYWRDYFDAATILSQWPSAESG
jgi:limonene-1,2-epoxide hydrolase